MTNEQLWVEFTKGMPTNEELRGILVVVYPMEAITRTVMSAFGLGMVLGYLYHEFRLQQEVEA